MFFQIQIGVAFSITVLIILTINFDIVNSKPKISQNFYRTDLQRIRESDAIIDRCSQPYLKNGMARMKQRRKMVKFECHRGYQLIGSRYAGCIGGKWDTPTPVCAKSGCSKIYVPSNGFLTGESSGLKVELFCKESYQAAGNRIAYCDGENWDHELGNCRETSKTSQLWCDFETEDLCGWTQYDTNEFEWRRELGSDISNHFRTGPQHDHTSKIPFGGHYMLVEAGTLLSDERARLISPVYAANQSVNACFRMFYYMYGASVGSLRVYIKPISIDMETLIQESRYLFFIVSGNQRSVWHEAIFELDQFIEPFQLIIEGTGGLGHLSDIAIDDVALLHYNECINEQMITRKPPIEERDNIFDFQSCEARCNETQPSRLGDSRMADGGIVKSCDCHSDCDELRSCCPDFRNLCVFGVTDISETTVLVDETTTVEADIVTQISPFVTNMTRIVTLATSTMTSTKATTTTPAIITTTTTNSSAKTSITTRRLTTNWNTKFHTTKLIRTTGTVSTTPPTTYILTVMMQDDPESSHENFDWQDTSNVLQSEPVDPAPAPLLIIILVSLIFVSILLVAVISVIKYYRKNYGPENYKRNSEATNRRRNAANSEDFSDVRYLTSDEQIDFTLQTSET